MEIQDFINGIHVTSYFTRTNGRWRLTINAAPWLVADIAKELGETGRLELESVSGNELQLMQPLPLLD